MGRIQLRWLLANKSWVLKSYKKLWVSKLDMFVYLYYVFNVDKPVTDIFYMRSWVLLLYLKYQILDLSSNSVSQHRIFPWLIKLCSFINWNNWCVIFKEDHTAARLLVTPGEVRTLFLVVSALEITEVYLLSKLS